MNLSTPEQDVCEIGPAGRFLRDAGGAFWAAFFLALAISGFLLFNYYCISADGTRYIAAAENFYAGNFTAGLASFYPPGYPALLAFAYYFVGDWERAGQLISLIARALLFFPLYALLRDLYGKTAAALGCFLAALSPFLALYSVHVRTESLFFLLALLALSAFHFGMERRRAGHFFVGGLLAGFAYLVRPEALGFVILIPAVLLFLWRMQRRWNGVWIAKASLVMLAGFLILAAPYVVYLSRESGQWLTFSRKAGSTLWDSLRDAELLDAEVTRNFPTRRSMSLPEFVRREPWVYTKKVLGDLAPSVGIYFEALHYSYLPFLLLGWWKISREGFWRRKDFLLFAYLIFFMVAFTAVYVNRRYSLQLVPISMGWTALGVLACRDWVKSRFNEKTAKALLAALVLAFLGSTLPKTLEPVGKDKAHFKDAGHYARARYGPGDLHVMVSDERIAYYAAARAIHLRDEWSESDIVAQMQRQNAGFLIAERKFLASRCPGFLSSPEGYGLRFEKEFVGRQKDRLLVFAPL